MKNLNQKMKDFLSETLVSVLATLDQNGSPRTRAIWHDWTEKEGLLLFTSSSSLKWLNILNDNGVSLCIDDPTPPYRSLVLDGIALKIPNSSSFLFPAVLRMATRYYGPVEGARFAENYRSQNKTLNPNIEKGPVEELSQYAEEDDVVLFTIEATRITSQGL